MDELASWDGGTADRIRASDEAGERKIARWFLFCAGLLNLVDIPLAVSAGASGAFAVTIGAVLALVCVVIGYVTHGRRRLAALYVLAVAVMWPGSWEPVLLVLLGLFPVLVIVTESVVRHLVRKTAAALAASNGS
jgi:O-antigen/teichoic acid export membrane protein